MAAGGFPRRYIETQRHFDLALRIACPNCGARPLQLCRWDEEGDGYRHNRGHHADRLTLVDANWQEAATFEEREA